MPAQRNKITVAALAALVGGRVIGNGDLTVERVADIDEATSSDIAFADDAKARERAVESQAACLIVPEGFAVNDKTRIEVKNPKLAFARIAEVLHPRQKFEPSIHPTAIIAASAQVDETVFAGARVCIGERVSVGAGTEIYAGTVIGDGVEIGRECVIHPNVTIYANVTIGDRVILHAGVVVGADGFGYVRDEAGYRKFPQIGTVIIEDNVEIGANSCIDRGALGSTRIGRGTKIDNLVQIAHNVEIGERVVIAAQTGISGSTVIEDDCVIGGQVGMGDHARVERGAIIGSKAGVLPGKIVRGGQVYWGVPVRPLDEYKRLNAHFGRLPQMREEIEKLRCLIADLMKQPDEKSQG
jgi:UDP-3-O-[3-hydroxymyristoyl] glucosamine N-acyltransferase